jgi:filamentous hemagglutinin family protein
VSAIATPYNLEFARAHTKVFPFEMTGTRDSILRSVLGSALTTRKLVVGVVGACSSLMTLMSAPALSQTVATNALPTGGQVVAGAATMAQTGNALQVHQTTNRAVIDWKTFSVGSNAQVTFQQPDANSVTLNRVTTATASQIHGALSANGKVIISNAEGVTFGK